MGKDCKPYALLWSTAAQTVGPAVPGTTAPPVAPIYHSFSFSNFKVGGGVKTFGSAQINGIVIPEDGVYDITVDFAESLVGETDAYAAILRTPCNGKGTPIILEASALEYHGSVLAKLRCGDIIQVINPADTTIVLDASSELEEFEVTTLPNLKLTIELI